MIQVWSIIFQVRYMGLLNILRKYFKFNLINYICH